MLSPHFQPVFGSARAVEHEVAAFQALKLVGLLGKGFPDEFTLVCRLRVTRAKARSLLYVVALRRPQFEVDFRQALIGLFEAPRIVIEPSGMLVSLEIPDPFLMDQVHDFLRQKGFLADGSFSRSIAKFPVQALAVLLEEAIPAERLSRVMEKLKAQGLPGKDWAGLVIGVVGRICQQFAGEAGAEIGQEFTKVAIDWLKSSH